MLDNKYVTCLINFEAGVNFISHKYITQEEIVTREKSDSYKLDIADSQLSCYNLGQVNKETILLKLQISSHCKKILFNVTEISCCDILLGLL